MCTGKKRVAKLMQRAKLVGISPRKPKFTMVRDPDAKPSPDLVRREFTATADKVWVADITYVTTWAASDPSPTGPQSHSARLVDIAGPTGTVHE